MADTLAITVEFTGGLEMLFDNVPKHSLEIPAKDDSGKPATAGFLIRYLCDKVIKDPRKDLFVLNGTIRNGILVLINDADWGLEGEDQYKIQKDDNFLFVSTLHGG